MKCPICSEKVLPEDASVAEMEGKKVLLRGRIYAIIDDAKAAHYSPFSALLTVSLYPRKGSVKYLKFEDREDLEQWHFQKDASYLVEGHRHVVDGNELIFDLKSVRGV